MDDIKNTVNILERIAQRTFSIYECGALETAISALQELGQYRERIEQLKHAEVIIFRCKLPDGRICNFTDFIKFLEKGEVE